MKKILVLAAFCCVLAGCRTIEIPVAEPWEGHYLTTEEFHMKTQDINLKKDQSIWVLSNGTMYRLLKKVEK